MSELPLVTVVIPTYNRWPLVCDAVRSVQHQTVGPIEIVVVDDGSTDGTSERLREEFDVVVLTRRNSERGASRNAGAERATGQYLCFLDSDDVLDREHFRGLLPLMSQGVPAIGAAAVLWDPENNMVQNLTSTAHQRPPTLWSALWGTPLPPSCLVVRKDIFRAVGGFPEQRDVAGSEDWVFMVRLLAFTSLSVSRQQTVRIREHPGRSMVDEAIVRSRRAALQLLSNAASDGLTLTARDLRRARAGAEYFAAAHFYSVGDMRRARAALRRSASASGFRLAVFRSVRLYLQTMLGVRGSQRARQIKRRFAQRQPFGQGPETS